MRLYFFLFVLFAVAVSGCKNEPANTSTDATTEHMHEHTASGVDNSQPPLFNEIMKVHDEVMPKMKDIEELKENLRMKIDTIDLNMPSSKYRKDFKYALAELNRADDMMTDWMHNFKDGYDSIQSAEGKNDFLEMERAKIEQVKIKMETSIKIASQTLQNTPMQ